MSELKKNFGMFGVSLSPRKLCNNLFNRKLHGFLLKNGTKTAQRFLIRKEFINILLYIYLSEKRKVKI